MKHRSIFSRIYIYLILWVPVVLFVTLVVMNETPRRPVGSAPLYSEFEAFIYLSLYAFFMVSVPLITEIRIWNFRKKHGLSYWKNIDKELKQINMNEEVAMHQEALKANNAKDATSEIANWHLLKEQGAITEEEFEKKKAQLLNL